MSERPAIQDDSSPGSPSVVTSVWRLRLIGGFSLQSDDQTLDRLRSRAATVLLAKLAVNPQRDVAREGLTDMLWSDAAAQDGRSRMRQTVSLLRAVFEPPGGPSVLHADRRSLRLVADAVVCDVIEFEQAARLGDHATAHVLYRGELLPGQRWLDGLPFAIELTASRARSLTPAHMLSLLEAARQDLSAPAASLAWLSRRGSRSPLRCGTARRCWRVRATPPSPRKPWVLPRFLKTTLQ